MLYGIILKPFLIHSKLYAVFTLEDSLNPHKFPWPDHLRPRVLKECAIKIAPIFCSLLNRSFFAGEVTYEWKIANIVPVHKKGRKDCRRNSRQISLSSIACKVREKVVKDRVVKFGFLKGKSILTQLLCCFDD